MEAFQNIARWVIALPSILAQNKLTQEQMEMIRTLQERCRLHDGIKGSLFLENTLNFYPDMPCFYLLLGEDSVQGVLSVFAPTKQTAEICAYVQPEARKQGYFKQMFSDAFDTLQAYGYQTAIFVHEYKCAEAKSMINRWPVSLEHAEYLLVYRGNIVREMPKLDSIDIREVEQGDLMEIAALSGNIFGDTSISDSLTYKSFYDHNVRYYCAVCNEQIIGVCSVRQSDEALYIYGFGIAQNYRGQGYGRAFLYHVLDSLKNKKQDILLEVDSTNRLAFTLYVSSGFAIRTQFDYYECNLEDLAPFVKKAV
jgi:ribosomal protein S18 acetylase RimI-like enzyme